MRHTAAVLAILIGVAAGGPSLAAPQVLGLSASNAPIPLTCDDEICTAIAGTFCLQRQRAIPAWGALYDASHPERLTLALLSGDDVTRLSGGPWIKFAAYAGYTMVRMSVPRALLAAHGATAAAIEIGPGIALVPRPQVDDTDPQGTDEIALATGPMRIAAARYLDRPSIGPDAARLVATLVNALPERRTIHDDNSGLWQRAITEEVAGGFAPSAVSDALNAYDRCRYQSDLRRCLISRHRELMEHGNARFWDETAGY